jgi:hypothetical protein
VRRGGELAHVQPDLGDDDLGGVAADPGDLVQAVHYRQGRSQQLAGLGVDAAAVGVTRCRPRRLDPRVGGCCGAAARAGCWGLRGGDRGDRLLDQRGELIDLAAQRVDLVQQHPRQRCVVVVEAAGEGLHQRGVLDA